MHVIALSVFFLFMNWITKQSVYSKAGDEGERIVTESETGIAGFKYSWKKTEATAQDRTGLRKVVLWPMLHRK